MADKKPVALGSTTIETFNLQSKLDAAKNFGCSLKISKPALNVGLEAIGYGQLSSDPTQGACCLIKCFVKFGELLELAHTAHGMCQVRSLPPKHQPQAVSQEQGLEFSDQRVREQTQI